MKKTFKVEGMMCAHCSDRLTKVLSNVDGVTSVNVSLENKTCEVDFDIDETVIKEAVEDAGFEVIG